MRNRLLSTLAPPDFERIRPHLVRSSVEARETLVEPGRRIERVFFPESGLISLVSPNEVATEIGMVGREGFAGASVLLDVEAVPLHVNCQMAGAGIFLETSVLLEAAGESRSLRSVLTRYVHVTMMQMASTVYANAHFTVEQRLARWLLMVHDRVDGDELRLTHDFLALMLCVRRPGVTVATHVLEGIGAIRAKRAAITILDRGKLMEIAGDSYGMAEAEYERVIEPKIRADALQAVV